LAWLVAEKRLDFTLRDLCLSDVTFIPKIFMFNLIRTSVRVRIREYIFWIIIGSDRRPETKQGIQGKIDRFRSGRVSQVKLVTQVVGLGLGIIDRRSEPDR